MTLQASSRRLAHTGCYFLCNWPPNNPAFSRFTHPRIMLGKVQSIWDATAMLSVLRPWALSGESVGTLRILPPSLVTIPRHQHPLLLRFSKCPLRKMSLTLLTWSLASLHTRRLPGVSSWGFVCPWKSPEDPERTQRGEKEVENRTMEGLTLALGRGLFLED